MIISPFWKTADFALSVKMFMPLLNDKLPLFLRKPLCFRQFPDLESLGLSEFDGLFDVEDRLAAAKSHVNMDWPMIVALEKETVTVFLKHLRHELRLLNPTGKAKRFVE